MSPYAIIIGATLIWLAAVVSPGPNCLVVSRLALSRSRRSAIGATVGIMLAGYLKVRREVDRVVGTLLIVLGLKVALDAR